MARTGDERRQQRREQRGAESGEAAGVGPTGRVEPQFLRGRPVVADGRVLDGLPLRRRAAALVDDGALRAGNAVRSGLGNGRRGPVVEHRAAAGRPGAARRAWCAAPGWRHGRAHRRRAAGAEPRGGSRRASAGRRGATGHGRGSAGHLTRAGRGGSPRGRRRTARTHGRTGVRGRSGSCLRGAPRRRLRASRRGAVRRVPVRRMGDTGMAERRRRRCRGAVLVHAGHPLVLLKTIPTDSTAQQRPRRGRGDPAPQRLPGSRRGGAPR